MFQLNADDDDWSIWSKCQSYFPNSSWHQIAFFIFGCMVYENHATKRLGGRGGGWLGVRLDGLKIKVKLVWLNVCSLFIRYS